MKTDENFFDQLRKQRSSESKNDTTSNDYLPQETETLNNTNKPFKQAKHTSKKCMQSTEYSNEKETETNSLAPECKRTLVVLIKQGVVLSRQKTKLFESVCRYQQNIRRHLANMYLKLVLDEKTGVAFVAKIDEADITNNNIAENNPDIEETVSLISRRTLSLFDTLLLLILRKHYQQRETAGEQKVIIDIERIESNLTPFLPLTNNSKSERKNLSGAIKKMTEKRILSAIKGSDDRYEITPIIRYVVNANFLETMLTEYQQLAIDTNIETSTSAILAEEI